ncbi:MAG TPA: hypothetical protein VFZ17_13960, partial [Acidimicrobiia bacterium]|nr:hypothetical protein [Acidimicrobiia bacterium]
MTAPATTPAVMAATFLGVVVGIVVIVAVAIATTALSLRLLGIRRGWGTAVIAGGIGWGVALLV